MLYAAGVKFQSPASRSTRWVGKRPDPSYAAGVAQQGIVSTPAIPFIELDAVFLTQVAEFSFKRRELVMLFFT